MVHESARVPFVPTRVVSHGFDMGDWKLDRETVVNGDALYLWTTPVTSV